MSSEEKEVMDLGGFHPSNVKGCVCVIGAGEYVGATLVQELLKRGYVVKGVVDSTQERDVITPLTNLPQASLLLKLYSFSELDTALQGCQGVFLCWFPFVLENPQNPDKDLIQPTIEKFLGIMRTIDSVEGIRKVIYNSCISAVSERKWEGASDQFEQSFTEDDWSDEEFLRSTERFYHLTRLRVESALWEYMRSDTHSFEFISLCPGLIVGPMVVPSITYGLGLLIGYLKGEEKEVMDKSLFLVDVRDVAEAHIKLFENDRATGRYLCVANKTTWKDIVQNLKDIVHDTRIPEKVARSTGKASMLVEVGSHRLERELGMSFNIGERALFDTVETLKTHNFYSTPQSPYSHA